MSRSEENSEGRERFVEAKTQSTMAGTAAEGATWKLFTSEPAIAATEAPSEIAMSGRIAVGPQRTKEQPGADEEQKIEWV